MGFRFRRSFKIAPGLKVNFNKNSVGLTAGTRGAHYTINSKGKKTKSVGIPGTGLSYTETTGGTKRTNSTGGSSSMDTKSTGKSNGCLTIVGIIFLIALAIAIYSFAWIPGLIALVYFALKKNLDKKQKLTRIGIAIAVIITSLMVSCSISDEPELSAVQISLNETEFDINDTAELKLNLTPEDASINTLAISENDIVTLDYTDEKAVISFIDEGTATFSVVANGTFESNSITITVIDKEAEAQRQEEAEQKAAEEEAQRLAEEEAKRQAEEQARIQAEAEAQRQAEEAAQQQTATQQGSTSTATENEDPIVYITNTGDKYHRAGCRYLKDSKIEKKLSEVAGKAPCGVCNPPTQ